MEARLKSAIQVQALIRRCDLATIGVAVTARGDPDAGAILVKLCGLNAGATVLAQVMSRRPSRSDITQPESRLVWNVPSFSLRVLKAGLVPSRSRCRSLMNPAYCFHHVATISAMTDSMPITSASE